MFHSPYLVFFVFIFTKPVFTAVTEEASLCRENQWQCRDGSCIGLDGRCNGIVDCADGSDETFPQCRKDQCQSNQFKCMYGACIDNALTCNGKKDCADNSDELIPRCRNQSGKISRMGFKCTNGQYIEPGDHCNGARDCSDGSDETLETCAGKVCRKYLYHCAYGGCTWGNAECDGKQDCVDGSDESEEICNRISSGVTTTPKPINPTGNCKLPPYPTYGTYSVPSDPNAVPGQSYTSVLLNITCYPGYGAEENRDSILCFDGTWSSAMPKCVRFCRLNKHSSVEYRCLSTGAVTGSRECRTLEPAGTIVQPICRYPNYYPGILSNMNCIDGSWDYVAQCKPALTNGTKITIAVKDKPDIIIYGNNNNIVINNDDKMSNIEVTGANDKEKDSDNNLSINVIPKDQIVFKDNVPTIAESILNKCNTTNRLKDDKK